MLHMIFHQWQELQRQIRRQHNWMLRTLDAIKTHILSSERDEQERGDTHSHHGSPKVSGPYPQPEWFHLSATLSSSLAHGHALLDRQNKQTVPQISIRNGSRKGSSVRHSFQGGNWEGTRHRHDANENILSVNEHETFDRSHKHTHTNTHTHTHTHTHIQLCFGGNVLDSIYTSHLMCNCRHSYLGDQFLIV